MSLWWLIPIGYGVTITLLALIVRNREDRLEARPDDQPPAGAHRPERLGLRACRVAVTDSGSFLRLNRGGIAFDSGFFAGDLLGGDQCAV